MNVLIAGAGGILGQKLVERHLARGDNVAALVLRSAELRGLTHPRLTVREGDVTRPDRIRGLCDGQERVVSCIGITRLKGRLTHEDVDYKGNLNLLREAERAGVRMFGFISPAGTDRGHDRVPLLAAKHRFEQELRRSAIGWVVFRSGGFFSDLAEMKKLAGKGPLFVIGDGSSRSTPICAEDLAGLMVDGMDRRRNEVVEVGGPEHLTWMDICRMCFEALNKPVRVIRVPVWLCRAALPVIRPLSFRSYAMGELLLFMSTRDVCTPACGKLTLRDYLAQAE